jgi:hypothetical protein
MQPLLAVFPVAKKDTKVSISLWWGETFSYGASTGVVPWT